MIVNPSSPSSAGAAPAEADFFKVRVARKTELAGGIYLFELMMRMARPYRLLQRAHT